ncbi:MAG TPA: hypothetical protein PKD85_05490 [Saprospiraceae bacterium]|nr:hypothetical protein [Saprospiraceae bacterium]
MIKGYFKDDQLVGFYTCLNNLGRLDAHFLGYDKAINEEHQLYLNMLYDMIQLGIDQKCYKIFMSRTAIEIKNSVGAVPYDMVCYFRHNNTLVNTFVKPIFEIYKPKNDHVLRSPFKTNFQTIDNKPKPQIESFAFKKLVCKK